MDTVQLGPSSVTVHTVVPPSAVPEVVVTVPPVNVSGMLTVSV
jgi:hypothetical protein